MAAFNSYEHFQQYSDEILDILEDYMSPSLINSKTLEVVEGEANTDDRRLSTSINVSISDGSVKPPVDGEAKCEFFLTYNFLNSYIFFQLTASSNEPIHILNIAIRGVEELDDSQMSKLFQNFCYQNKVELLNRRVRRITFASLKK
jgi:acetyl-CoA carboxylase/biotin carboxylase 1